MPPGGVISVVLKVARDGDTASSITAGGEAECIGDQDTDREPREGMYISPCGRFAGVGYFNRTTIYIARLAIVLICICLRLDAASLYVIYICIIIVENKHQPLSLSYIPQARIHISSVGVLEAQRLLIDTGEGKPDWPLALKSVLAAEKVTIKQALLPLAPGPCNRCSGSAGRVPRCQSIQA